jgi:hypothetical protein
MLRFLMLMIATEGVPSGNIISDSHHPLNTAFSQCVQKAEKRLIAIRADHGTVYETIEKRCDRQLRAVFEEVRRININERVNEGDARINAGDTVTLMLQDKVAIIDEKIARKWQKRNQQSAKMRPH